MKNTFTDLKELVSALSKAGNVPGIIVYSDDHYPVEETYRAYQKYLKKKFPHTEEIHINGREDQMENFHAELSTIPLFGEARYIWVRHADTIFDKIKANKKVLSRFVEDLSRIPETTPLLIHLDEKKLPADFKFLEEKFLVFTPAPLREKDVVAYIQRRSETAGYTMEKAAAGLLADICHQSQKYINEALNRLYLYKIAEKTITEDDVAMAALDIDGNYYFAILDLIAEKKISKALHHAISQSDGDSTMMFTGIVKLFTDTYRYMMLRKNQVASVMDIIEDSNSAWMKKKSEERIQKVIRNYGYSGLEKIILSFPELDHQRKANPKLESHTLINFIHSLNF